MKAIEDAHDPKEKTETFMRGEIYVRKRVEKNSTSHLELKELISCVREEDPQPRPKEGRGEREGSMLTRGES